MAIPANWLEIMAKYAVSILLGLSVLLPMGIASPAHAVTCDEVRALTPAQIEHWAKRLKVPSQHLGSLLKTAFCDARRAQPDVVASTSRPNSDPMR